jgi:hypothetical protein
MIPMTWYQQLLNPLKQVYRQSRAIDHHFSQVHDRKMGAYLIRAFGSVLAGEGPAATRI